MKERSGWTLWDNYRSGARSIIAGFQISWILLLLPFSFALDLSLQQWLYLKSFLTLVSFIWFYRCTTKMISNMRTFYFRKQNYQLSPALHSFVIYISTVPSALHMVSVFSVFYALLFISVTTFFSLDTALLLLTATFFSHLMNYLSLKTLSRATCLSFFLILLFLYLYGGQSIDMNTMMESSKVWVWLLPVLAIYTFLVDVRNQKKYYAWFVGLAKKRKEALRYPSAPLSTFIYPLLKCIFIPYFSFYYLLDLVISPVFSPFCFAMFFLLYQLCGMLKIYNIYYYYFVLIPIQRLW